MPHLTSTPLLKQQQGVLSGGKLYKFLREAMGGGAKMTEE